MPSKKLVTLLDTFSTADRKKFRKYLVSPFYNENEDLVSLYDIILQMQDRMNRVEASPYIPDKQAVWRALKGNKRYNDGAIRRLSSELTQHAYQFLAVAHFSADPLREKLLLLSVLKNTDLDKHFNGITRQALNILEEQEIKNAKYRLQGQQLNYLLLLRKEGFGKDPAALNLLSQADFHLDCYYILQKLRYYCNILGYKSLFATEEDIQLPSGFFSFVRRDQFMEQPQIRIYFLIAQMLMYPDKETYFREAKKHLKTHRKAFSPAELNTLYIYLKNYCITTKINTGRSEYFQELFQLFQVLIEDGILFHTGVLDPQDFKNIITVGLHVQEFEWVEHFIRNYTEKLPEQNRENAYNYNLAKVYFHQEQYGKVIEQLREVEYDDIVYALGSKLMLLKTYYELGEFLPLDSLIDSFRIYLRRNRMISREVKQQYLNVLRFVKKLSKVDPYQKEALRKIEKQAEECKALAAKKWILTKTEEMLSGRQ